jgi:hypothetical protein
MSPKTATRLTPRQRLTRGLTYTAVGPVSGLPAALQQARRSQRRSRRPWLIAGIAAAAGLAAGAVVFSVIRRSSRSEPSPRPPSVDVQPRP